MLKPEAVAQSGLDPEALFAGIAECRTIGLAVSGGPDSLALMLLVHAWVNRADRDRPKVIVYSVDHRLRPESAEEMRTVTGLAEQFGFGARGLVWSDDKPATGVQAAARAARYRLMAGAMAEDGAEAVLTAHHAEDQAETILMRMAHGSGLSGLSGMGAWAEVEGAKLHRPLLGISKKVLHQIVRASGLSAAFDPSNADEKYERVRWRQALPRLAELGLETNDLVRLANRLRRADAAMTETAKAYTAQYVQLDFLGILSVDWQIFSQFADEIALRVVAAMFARLGQNEPRLEQLESLLDQLRAGEFPGSSLGGCTVGRRQNRLIVCREAGRMRISARSLEPGQGLDWDGRFRITNRGSQPLQVRMATDVSRARAEEFLGVPIAVPMAAVRAAPMVCDADGEMLAFGTHSAKSGVEISHLG